MAKTSLQPLQKQAALQLVNLGFAASVKELERQRKEFSAQSGGVPPAPL